MIVYLLLLCTSYEGFRCNPPYEFRTKEQCIAAGNAYKSLSRGYFRSDFQPVSAKCLGIKVAPR
jgi:hypothetical protein